MWIYKPERNKLYTHSFQKFELKIIKRPKNRLQKN